ncbi:MAG: hypothetical protein J3R72DRAFT_445851, partial [Linnemannia gamsii]
MNTACQQFFNTPELLGLLASVLESAELAKLCQCSRRFNRELAPSLFKNINISCSYMLQGQTILSSMPFLTAFGRNIHHTRALGIGPIELVFYYNCILAFADLQWPRSDSPATPSSLPNWLPPADPQKCQILPLTPATNLQSLCLMDNLVSGRSLQFQLLSADNEQAVTVIFCWLILLNPRLRYLESHHDPIVDLSVCRLLGKVISGLAELMELDLTVACDDDMRFQVGSTIFYHCGPLIRKFKLLLRKAYYDIWYPRWKLSDVAGDADWMVENRKKEPLTNLEELKCWAFDEGVATEDILAIFARCPNIKKLDIPALSNDSDHNAIGNFIGKECPQLRSLCCGAIDVKTEVAGLLAIRIMETLPAQQLENLSFYGTIFPLSTSSFTRPLQQHSTTLHTISIVQVNHLTSISLSPVFESCVNIKVLDIRYHPKLKTGLYVTLTDLLEGPWTLLKLTYLTLGICGCKLPYDYYMDHEPYYSRPTPIVLSKEETDHFSRLEELYRRLGTLVELTHLTLEMVAVDAEEEWFVVDADDDFFVEEPNFPALMSLGDVKTGRPGYLTLLKDLKKLEFFSGSIGGDTTEFLMTVSLEECSWVLTHWPKISCIKCFDTKADVRNAFEWLRAQKEGLRCYC